MAEIDVFGGNVRLVRTTLTAAQVAALTPTSGVKIVSAGAGEALLPIYLEVRRPAGTAYTLAGLSDLAVGHDGVGSYLSVASKDFLDQTTAQRRFAHALWRGSGHPVLDDPFTYRGLDLTILLGSYEGDHTGEWEIPYLRGAPQNAPVPGLFSLNCEFDRDRDGNAIAAGIVADHNHSWERQYLSGNALSGGAQIDVTVIFLSTFPGT